MRRVYLASPYSHEDPCVRESRWVEVTKAGAQLMLEGNRVYGPITMSHSFSRYLPPETNTWEFWKNVDIPELLLSDLVVVLMLPGWQQSVGVTAEIQAAKDAGIPVAYMEWEL